MYKIRVKKNGTWKFLSKPKDEKKKDIIFADYATAKKTFDALQKGMNNKKDIELINMDEYKDSIITKKNKIAVEETSYEEEKYHVMTNRDIVNLYEKIKGEVFQEQ